MDLHDNYYAAVLLVLGVIGIFAVLVAFDSSLRRKNNENFWKSLRK